jgi:hypothetical protein
MGGPEERVQSSFSDSRSLAVSSLTGHSSDEIRISGLTPKPVENKLPQQRKAPNKFGGFSVELLVRYADSLSIKVT